MEILFVPHNAYHTRNFACALPYLDAEYVFVDVEAQHHEGSKQAIREIGLPSIPYHRDMLHKQRPHLVVVMNDWGGWPARLLREARRLGIPTAALVEGVQDFTDSHIAHTGSGERRRPYQHNEFPLLLGEYDRKFITDPRARIVGSPRFDEIVEERPSFHDPPLVSINSNFTYGLYTDVQEDWLRSAIRACEAEEFGCLVTRHHADSGVPEDVKVFDGTMHDCIRGSNVFVSRFSTGILEALCLGKPVVYYNPHGERQDTFQDPMGAFPVARTVEDLRTALREEIARPEARAAARREFLAYHLAFANGGASRRLAAVLTEILHETRDREIRYEIPNRLARFRGWLRSFVGGREGTG